MFRDREDAARRLADRLKGRTFRDPLVLAIPRGGVVTGDVLARALGAELDVVLARKLRAPGRPELAVGAVCEDGRAYLDLTAVRLLDLPDEYVEAERLRQMAEIRRRKQLFRAVLPQAPVAGRSVLLTDDGLATGSTVMAALRALRGQRPHEVIVAVPVAPPERAEQVRRWCDEFVCLLLPEWFQAVGQFYLDFRQVEDEEVVEILRRAAARAAPATAGACPTAVVGSRFPPLEDQP